MKKKQPITQKQTVFEFLKSLPKDTTFKQSGELFQSAYPGITIANFNFYRNQAIKTNIWTPAIEIESIKPIDLTRSTSNVAMDYVDVTIDLDKIDMSKFKAIATNTAFDKIASKRNGVMPGTTYIVTGESGAGKTTVCANIADYLKEANPDLTAGFISAEMDRDDWTEEVIDNPRLAMLKTVFMLEYIDAPNYLEILTIALSKYNFVILDSFEVIIDQLRDMMGWTAKKAESKLIDILRKAATESGTTIFAIQQYTKGGTFVGSNKIKHMLTGMIFVMFDKNQDRYLVFVKNRRGGHMVGKKLYFTKNKETGRLEFDAIRLNNDLTIMEHAKNEMNKIVEEQGQFDQIILEKAAEMQKKRQELLSVNRPAMNSLHQSEMA